MWCMLPSCKRDALASPLVSQGFVWRWISHTPAPLHLPCSQMHNQQLSGSRQLPPSMFLWPSLVLASRGWLQQWLFTRYTSDIRPQRLYHKPQGYDIVVHITVHNSTLPVCHNSHLQPRVCSPAWLVFTIRWSRGLSACCCNSCTCQYSLHQQLFQMANSSACLTESAPQI